MHSTRFHGIYACCSPRCSLTCLMVPCLPVYRKPASITRLVMMRQQQPHGHTETNTRTGCLATSYHPLVPIVVDLHPVVQPHPGAEAQVRVVALTTHHRQACHGIASGAQDRPSLPPSLLALVHAPLSSLFYEHGLTGRESVGGTTCV